MKKIAALFLAVCLAIVSFSFMASAKSNTSQNSKNISHQEATSDNSAPYYEGQVLVKYREGVSDIERAHLVRGIGPESTEKVTENIDLINLPEGMNTKSAVAELKYNDMVEFVQPNYIYRPFASPKDEPKGGQLWGLLNEGQWIGFSKGTPGMDINVSAAWKITMGSPEIIVAVIDQGVWATHEDLAENMWKNPGEIPGNGKDDDNNGYVDDIYGWDFLHNDASVFDSSDEDFHGTHVAGTIAASYNGKGVVGVAPKVKIMSCKFIGAREGSSEGAIKAIEYASKMGAAVANCSWGGNEDDQLLKETFQKANNVLFCAAAGNESSNNDKTPTYPASYKMDNIISVASINNKGGLSSFSNYGKTVDVAAPGSAILSCAPNNGYQSLDGTSMAAPHVSGVCALMFSNGITDHLDIKDKIFKTAKKVSALDGKVACGGIIDAGAVLSK